MQPSAHISTLFVNTGLSLRISGARCPPVPRAWRVGMARLEVADAEVHNLPQVSFGVIKDYCYFKTTELGFTVMWFQISVCILALVQSGSNVVLNVLPLITDADLTSQRGHNK